MTGVNKNHTLHKKNPKKILYYKIKTTNFAALF